MIHFLDFSNEKMVAKAADIATKTDILLGNLEDAIPVDRKEAAREGLIEVGRTIELGETQLWTRVNALESPGCSTTSRRSSTRSATSSTWSWCRRSRGRTTSTTSTACSPSSRHARHLTKPILVHAILETAQGVANVEEIATASPRMQGLSLGPADLAASRRMKTTRVGGGHPGYRVLGDPNGERTSAQQDLWHYTLGRMVDACASAGILPFYGPFGDIRDLEGCEAQFRAAYLMGCVGAWSLHPAQLDIARKVFSPDPDEVAFAKKVIEAIPDGRGVHMIDGKMQDDATWKQCRVMVDLAEMLARKDPELAAAYEL